MVFLLENRFDKIFKTEGLRDGKGELAGIVFSKLFGNNPEGKEVIFLSAAKSKYTNKDEIERTLIHEVLHVLMPGVQERYILQLESILWDLLSPEQKKIIKFFIPKHTVMGRVMNVEVQGIEP